MSDSVDLTDCKAGLVPLGFSSVKSDVLDDESTEKGVCEEDRLEFDLGCGGGGGDCGEAREANGVEKHRGREVDFVEKMIGSGPPQEIDTNGDILRGEKECGD
ncbi:hypothetical protein LXL04_034105 [Taraxacum kok-saghyz]